MYEKLKVINVNQRLSPEEHIILHIFSNYLESNISQYDDHVIDEALVNQFNYHVSDTDRKYRLLNYLRDPKIVDTIKTFADQFRETPWVYAKPIIWGDRQKSNYYIENLVLSHRFEIYIEHQLTIRGIELGLYYKMNEQYDLGENELGIEIKRDIMSRQTGNLYIEYAERLNNYGDWVESGINKKDNTKFYLIGDIDQFWIFKKIELIKLKKQIENSGGSLSDGCRKVKARRGTSLGFIIPKNVADVLSVTLEGMVKELKELFKGIL